MLSLKVMNIDDGVVFSSYSTDMDGVGTSEAAAFSDAVKRLSPKNQEMKHFILRHKTASSTITIRMRNGHSPKRGC